MNRDDMSKSKAAGSGAQAQGQGSEKNPKPRGKIYMPLGYASEVVDTLCAFFRLQEAPGYHIKSVIAFRGV